MDAGLMLLPLLIAAAQPVAAPDPVVIALVAGEGDRKCLPDKSLYLDVPGGAEVGDGGLVLTAPNKGDADELALPYGRDDGQTLSLWPHLIAVKSHDGAAADARQYLMGVIVGTSAMYSGGGGNGSRLHLLRLDTTPSNTRLGDEVLDVVWDSSLMIRACFSEADMKDRREACHDEYSFTGALSAGPAESGELPALTYRAVATTYRAPRAGRRIIADSASRPPTLFTRKTPSAALNARCAITPRRRAMKWTGRRPNVRIIRHHDHANRIARTALAAAPDSARCRRAGGARRLVGGFGVARLAARL